MKAIPAPIAWRGRLACDLPAPSDLSFLDAETKPFAQGLLFYESARAAREASSSVRQTLEQLS